MSNTLLLYRYLDILYEDTVSYSLKYKKIKDLLDIPWTRPTRKLIRFNSMKEIPLQMNDRKKSNSNNPLQFMKEVPLKLIT